MGLFGSKEPTLCDICGAEVKESGVINGGKFKTMDGVICRCCYNASGIIRMFGNCQDLTTNQIKDAIKSNGGATKTDGAVIGYGLILDYVGGLPGISENAVCSLRLDEKELALTTFSLPAGEAGAARLLVMAKEKGMESSMTRQLAEQTFRVPYERLLTIDTITKDTVESKNKSVIGRGIVGGLLFGTAGLILGGMSGIGTRQIAGIQMFLGIAYVDKSGEIQNILLDTGKWINEIQQLVISFNKNFKQEIAELETNEKGDIVL